jgi:acetyltransferase-like isoleucine patch superfamily enzyme
MDSQKVIDKFKNYWSHFWMLFGGYGALGKTATWLATLTAPPYYERASLARYTQKGYISPRATIYHSNLRIGRNVFIDDDVVIYQHMGSGKIDIGDEVVIQRGAILETGQNGSIKLGDKASVAFGSHLASHLTSIEIGPAVRIASGCKFYPHDHGDSREKHFEIKSKGPIIIDYGAWLGANVIVLSGVHIGREAAVAAGSVVTRDIPAKMIAAGNPARVLKARGGDQEDG